MELPMAKRPAGAADATPPSVDPARAYRVRLKRIVRIGTTRLAPYMQEVLLRGRVFGQDDPDRPGEKVMHSILSAEELPGA
jgi:hypothetical protein